MFTPSEWRDGQIWSVSRCAKYWAEHPDEIRSFGVDLLATRKKEAGDFSLFWRELRTAVDCHGLDESWVDWWLAHVESYEEAEKKKNAERLFHSEEMFDETI